MHLGPALLKQHYNGNVCSDSPWMISLKQLMNASSSSLIRIPYIKLYCWQGGCGLIDTVKLNIGFFEIQVILKKVYFGDGEKAIQDLSTLQDNTQVSFRHYSKDLGSFKAFPPNLSH